MSDLFFDKESDFEEDSENQNYSSDNANQEIKNEKNQMSLADSTKKNIHKNKYINKIKDIVPQASVRTIPIVSSNKELPEEIKSLDKKERNKYSAKQSRDRKKLYIEILEDKQKSLAKLLESRKKELEETKKYLDRVVNQNKTMSSFTASRHQMMKKIQGLLERAKNGEDPSNEINAIIDSLRYRIGATGKERINTINQYFRQIVNLSLPALHRYMMWSAAEGKHLFSSTGEEEENDQWFLELKNALNLSEEQKKLIQSKQEFLRDQKHILQKLINDLKNIKNEIEEKSIELEDMIDGIRDILTPIQAAHFILFIEKNKYRKQLNLCEATIDDDEPNLRKVIKREENE